LPNGDIEIPATNPLNTTQSINGTTFKYILADILQYILIAQGFTTYTSCRVATTAALTTTYANGVAGVGATLTNAGAQVALSIDGVTLALADRVLIKNQINTFENGIYVVTNIGSGATNWILTRADDYNQSFEIVYLGVVAITQGTQNAGLVFQENSQGPFVIGTSPITFQQLQIDITLLPSASPANKILRSDGTYWVQSTNASLDSSDKLYNISELQVDNININGNTITSTNVGGNIVITPNTVGSIVLDGLNWPQVDGTSNQALVTNGAGQLSWASFGSPYTPSALTEVDDANVTMTLGGSPNTALLQAVSMTLGWNGQLSISRGGTNTNTLGSSGQLAQSDGTKYAWTTATYPATATAIGTILRANGTNWVATTATYPATTTINQILYSSANSVIGEITTANSAALVTNASGVPSFTSSMTDGQLVIGKTGDKPSTATITAGTGISVTNGAGSITITNTSTASGQVNPGVANQITYYATTGSAVSGLTGANGSVLVTDNTGVPSMLANPAANYRTLMSQNAGIPVWSTAAYPNTATATGTIIRANGINWAATTATYPDTTTINQLLFSSANNVISEIATANNGVLITSAGGVPSISSTLPTAVQGNITSVGTIGSGTWNGGIIGSAYGGTGVNNGTSTITLGGSLTTSGAFASTFTMTGITTVTFPTSGTLATTSQLPTPSAMTKVDDTNVTLTLGGSPATSLLQAVSLTLGWSGQLGVTRGGTGASSVGTNGTLAQSNGSIYTFTTATYPSTTTANQLLYSSATNTVSGLSTANSATLVTNASGVPAWTGSMTNGQVLIGSTGATPVLSTLTAAGGITITNAAGAITISGSGGGFSWTEVTGVAQTMVANNGYVTSNAGQVVLTLPATSVIGDTIKVQGKGTGGWKVAQNAGQLIHFNSSTTTLGVLGYIESTQRYNSVELVCITNTNEWAVNSASGNLTVF
jgi:hypothetical protein